MQDLPRRNRLTRTETKPFHLSGRTRGSASCSQGAGGQAKHLGREIVTQPNVRDLDDVQEPARKDVGLLLSHVLPRWCSYQSRMASPSACIQIPDRRI